MSKLKKTQPHAYMVLHSLPGEEAQVDFGYIGTLRVSGSPRKAWVFVMSLSYSRYMYVEITLDQSIGTFIRCHANAFRYFGGVPETVKIDNLKAAIVETDFYEPMDVDVIEVNQLLKIYYEGKEIALHSLLRNAKGEHRTDKSHYPSTKNITQEEILSRYREQMGQVGDGAVAFLEAFKDTEMYKCHHYRSIAGILALRKKYDDEVLNQACRRACHYGSITYRTVKKICENGLYALPLEEKPENTLSGRSNIRSLADYREMTGLGVIGHE